MTTTKIKTSVLIGQSLDWAVSKASGYTFSWDSVREEFIFGPETLMCWLSEYRPSSDWSQGGPIIEREAICILTQMTRFDWQAIDFRGDITQFGNTPLVAAMRCYVASKLGTEVEIPIDLL